jgi:hypothetical protein
VNRAGKKRASCFALAALLLAGCDRPSADDGRKVVVRLHGDGKVGEACEAQSDCGYRQRCVYRGADWRSAAVEKGVCEADDWPGGCFAMLPLHRLSKAEKEAARRAGRKGLKLAPVCH